MELLLITLSALLLISTPHTGECRMHYAYWFIYLNNICLAVKTIADIDCGKMSNLCLEQEVIFRCNITGIQYLEWYVPEYDYEMDFAVTSFVGMTETQGCFTAILNGKNGYYTSDLMFSQKLEYNNTNITCSDGHNQDERKACTVTLAGKVIIIL